MEFQKCISIKNREMICTVGGGGKTTALLRLGKELLNSKKRVLLTTTTKMYVPQQQDILTIVKQEADIMNNPEILTGDEKLKIWGRGICKPVGDNKKILGVKCSSLDHLFEQDIIDYILVEADGARKKPIKAPAGYEPCIPKKTTIVLGLIGIDAVGKTLNEENFHRVDIFIREKGFIANSIINTDMVTTLINWEQGLFKNVMPGARKILVINKIDNLQRQNAAKEIAHKLLNQKTGVIPERIIFSSFDNSTPKIDVFYKTSDGK